MLRANEFCTILIRSDDLLICQVCSNFPAHILFFFSPQFLHLYIGFSIRQTVIAVSMKNVFFHLKSKHLHFNEKKNKHIWSLLNFADNDHTSLWLWLWQCPMFSCSQNTMPKIKSIEMTDLKHCIFAILFGFVCWRVNYWATILRPKWGNKQLFVSRNNGMTKVMLNSIQLTAIDSIDDG